MWRYEWTTGFLGGNVTTATFTQNGDLYMGTWCCLGVQAANMTISTLNGVGSRVMPAAQLTSVEVAESGASAGVWAGGALGISFYQNSEVGT